MSVYMGAKKLLGKFLLKCFYRCKIEGADNIPPEGRVLVCSNHISLHDPIMIAAISKRQICYMGKKELFGIPIFGGFLKSLGAFPVDRKSGSDVGAIRHCLKLLEEENAVGIFPQGTRHKGVSPEGTPIQTGAGMLVEKTKCTVLPVCVKTKKFKVTPFFGKVTVKMGKPISYEELTEGMDELSGSTKYKAISEKIFEGIVELL